MKVGEEKTFRIESLRSLRRNKSGPYTIIPKINLQSDVEVEIGMILTLGTEDGQQSLQWLLK
jgi:hypothetical protein